MKEHSSLALKFILGFSIAGFLFSGYLTAVKVFSGLCAFNEACPIFWGHPACWYGFALYVALLSIALLTHYKRMTLLGGFLTALGISFIGILFAGYLTVIEVPELMAKGFSAYTFGVPTCFYGLVFFMLIFLSSALGYAHNKEV